MVSHKKLLNSLIWGILLEANKQETKTRLSSSACIKAQAEIAKLPWAFCLFYSIC